MKIEEIEEYIGTNKLLLVQFKTGLELKGQFLSVNKTLNGVEFKTLRKTSLINVDYIEKVTVIVEHFVEKLIIDKERDNYEPKQ